MFSNTFPIIITDLLIIFITRFQAGFVSGFLSIKSYSSFLSSKISQLCYKGILRAVSLGSTDGISTWKCSSLFCLQPVLVPVGRVALGRIFDVMGCSVDPYIDNALSCQSIALVLILLEDVTVSIYSVIHSLRCFNHFFSLNLPIIRPKLISVTIELQINSYPKTKSILMWL